MTDPLLMLDIYFKIADHHDAAFGPNTVATTRELARLHVALHDVDTVLLIEGNAGHLIKANDVVLADKPALPIRHIDEHACNRGLAAGDEVGVRRYLLKKVALPCTPGAELNHIVILLDEGDHAKEHCISSPLAERVWFKANTSEEEVFPFGSR